MSDKVIMLYYPMPDGRSKAFRALTVQEQADFNELESRGMMCRRFRHKDFIEGKVRMFYGEDHLPANVKLNGVVYHGPVLFIARDESGCAVDLTARQMTAIKMVVERL